MTHDVLIVGAGPAGSSCALALARAGFNTAIIEKKTFPRTKACGEYLSPGTVRRLNELGVAEAVTPHATILRGARLFGSGVGIELPFPSPAWAVPRRMLDEVLLQAAVQAGAQLVSGRAGRVVDEADGVNIDVTDSGGRTRRLAGRMAVGADGMHSIAAQSISSRQPATARSRFALGGHYSGFESLDEFIEMYVDRGTYVALNPLGASSANLIVVAPPALLRTWSGNVDAHLREHAMRASDGRRNFAAAKPLGERVASPLTMALHPMTGRSLILVGDAAAFVDPFVGQGIYLALGSAARAAASISDALHGRLSGRSAMAAYERAQRREILERRRLAAVVRTAVNVPFLARRAAARVNRSPERVRSLLDAIAGLGPAAPGLGPLAVARLFA